MASHLHLLFILFLVTITQAFPIQTHPSFHNGFFVKLTKDNKTQQYTTQLLIGTPQLPTKLVVHLSGDSLWLNCPPISSSRHIIGHKSLPCLMAKSIRDDRTKTATICEIQQENPITGVAFIGDLVEDIVNVAGNDPALTLESLFLFSCSPEYLVKGLSTGAKGVLGFGRSKIAFQSQMVNSFDLPRKFTLCLSSSTGFIISGISNSLSLSYTPLISTHGVQGYYMNVNSIKVSGRRLVLQPIRGVEISSIIPYTTMKSTTYSIFTKAYLSAANSMNMTVVPPVAPFGVCFKSQSKVPEIELVLQSVMVKWGIQRRNSMVQVSDSVMCLGFLDGGLGMNGEVVLGGYQLEDHIMEFNLGTGMMGFSSSLLMNGNSCSNIRASLSTPTESL